MLCAPHHPLSMLLLCCKMAASTYLWEVWEALEAPQWSSERNPRSDGNAFLLKNDSVPLSVLILSLGGLAPAYLADDCRLSSGIGRRPLRSNSNDIRKLLVPRTHNKLGDRSFSAAGPRLWNDLPPGLRRPGLTFDSFRQSLKTHLFGDRSA